PADVAGEVSLLLEDPQVFRGNKINRLKSAVTELQDRIDTTVEEQRVKAIDDINARWQQIPAGKAYQDATEVAQQSVTQKAQRALDQVREESQIPVIRSLATTFADTTYPEILDELAAAAPAPEPVVNPDPDIPDPPAPVPAKHTIALNKLDLLGTGDVLETAADVDRYLDQLRETLLTTSNENKRIAL